MDKNLQRTGPRTREFFGFDWEFCLTDDAGFPGEEAVGRDLRLNNVLFRVIGVLPVKGANMMGMDQDDTVVVPWTTMRNRLSRSGGS